MSGMNNEITLSFTTPDGLVVTYKASNDRRITEVIDGKVVCRSDRAAMQIAGEARAFGIKEARALGCAVVFWS